MSTRVEGVLRVPTAMSTRVERVLKVPTAVSTHVEGVLNIDYLQFSQSTGQGLIMG